MKARPAAAYTLVEMVAVMALVAVLTLAATASYHAWGPSTSMRSAENAVLGSLSRARQLAISSSRPVSFNAVNATNSASRSSASASFFALATADPEDFDFDADFGDSGKFRPYGPTNALPRGVTFSNAVFNVVFKPDGSCRAPGFDDDLDFTYTLNGRRLARRIRVNRLTGLARLCTGDENEAADKSEGGQ